MDIMKELQAMEDAAQEASDQLSDIEGTIENIFHACKSDPSSLLCPECGGEEGEALIGAVKGRQWLAEILEVLAREEALEWDYEWEAVLIFSRAMLKGSVTWRVYEDIYAYLRNAASASEYNMYGNRERAESFARACERIFKKYVTWWPCMRFETVGLFGAGLKAKPNTTEWHDKWREGWGEAPEGQHRDS